MKYNLISASFVGIWEKPLSNIPNFDRKFCLDLFSDPYNTTCGLTQEGFVVARQFSPPPHPSVIISPNRIQVTELTIPRTCEVTNTFLEILTQTNPADMLFPFSSIGVNMEHEWTELFDTFEKTFSKTFFQNPFPDSLFTIPYDIRFETKLASGLKFNFILQPRAGHKNGIFLGSNDDRFWSEKPIPTKELLLDMFTESAGEIRKHFDPLFT